MKRVFRIQGKGARKDIELRGLAAYPEVADVNATVALIQTLIPFGLRAATEALVSEVTRLAGPKHCRTDGVPGYVRWYHQRGSIYPADQKLPIIYQRVQDLPRNQEIPLATYQQLQTPRAADAWLFRKLLLGLSSLDYEACAEAVPEAFGLSPSSVSPAGFIRASAKQLWMLQERHLDTYNFVGLVLDGKTFAEDSRVIALAGGEGHHGVRADRHRTRDRLRHLPPGAGGPRSADGARPAVCHRRGQRPSRKALQTAFGDHAAAQRCQWHTRENILAYLPKRQRTTFRRKLQAAYERPSYPEAKAALLRIRQALRLLNESAVKSLDEGFEETLTLHWLGLFPRLGVSLKTTTCLESLNTLLGQRTDKVDRWRTSDQKQRWLAAALLEIEPRLRRIKGFRALPLLRQVLHADLGGDMRMTGTHVA